jgi:hypothetical protein
MPRRTHCPSPRRLFRANQSPPKAGLGHLNTAIPRTRGQIIHTPAGQLRAPQSPIPRRPQQQCTEPPRVYPPNALDLVDNTTIISDRDKGLMPAIAVLTPGVNQAYYTRHLEQNVLGDFRGAQTDFRRLARAKDPRTHQLIYADIAKKTLY